MTLTFAVSDRFVEAAEEWSEARMMEFEDAMKTKAEQALLEIEHLVSGATDVDFDVDGERIHHRPSDELQEFLERQAGESGIDPETLLKLHVDLFARTFLEDDVTRPPNAPPK